MSHIKSAPQSPSEPFKWRSQARQLQEAFPTLSNDDIQSLLVEVGGDVELAGTRIADGSFQQWGEVPRKKDKKHPSTHSAQPAKEFSASRGDFRGGRGGRGSRGGSGRGGAGGRGRGGPANRGSVNGHTSRTGTPRPTSGPNPDAPSSGEHAEKTDIQDAWSAPPLTDKSKDGSWTEQSDAWGTAQPESTPAASWNSEAGTNGFPPQIQPVSKQPTKTPANSKMSWAQVARPQEKPIPSAPPALPSQIPPSVPLAPPSISPPLSAVEQTQQVGWEEPTTVEAPVWEEEPVKPAVSTPEGWNVVDKPIEESQDQSLPEQTENVVEDTTQAPSTQGDADSAVPTEPESYSVAPAQPPPVSIPTIAVTPSPKLAGRPAAAAHRASARHKISDQPVVMPNSFGANIEKIGMQFGSLSLGGDSLDNNTTEPDVPSTIVPVSVPEPTPNPPPPAPAPKQEEAPIPQPPAAAPPASSTSLNSVFQQSQAVSQPSQPSHTSTTQSSTSHHLPTSVSQPAQVQTATHSVSTISTHQQQTTTPHTSHISNHHQQQHPSALPQQTQQGHNLHHYTQQSLSAHHDTQALSPLHQQPQSASTHSTYFRQTDNAATSPYFHTPTPPSAQAQDNYSSFGQLSGQGHNQQGPHLGSFGPTEYGYNDSQRSFYESYNQQSGFSNRNVLGHDDLKSLPGAQQQPPSAGLSPSAGQASQQHTSQSNQQSAGGQAPQQGYPPPPVPYYYTHPYPQNQFYGPPYNSGYVPQPFVKYPAMFQPGPAGPGSAPSPAGKQPGSNVGLGVQPQNNPYNQSLYQPGSYDDYQHHTSHQQQQHQHSHSLGLGQGVGATGDYGKQLYGSGQGGMQAFMGLGQTSAGAGVPSSGAGGPRGNSSPETYKPYAPKDVGVGVGGRGGVQQGQGQIQGQPQGQGQGQNTQGPQGQGFYGANRFGASVGSSGVGVGGAPQNALHQQGPQAHLGYPQGAGDGAFYSYPGRQQYWPQ